MLDKHERAQCTLGAAMSSIREFVSYRLVGAILPVSKRYRMSLFLLCSRVQREFTELDPREGETGQVVRVIREVEVGMMLL